MLNLSQLMRLNKNDKTNLYNTLISTTCRQNKLTRRGDVLVTQSLRNNGNGLRCNLKLKNYFKRLKINCKTIRLRLELSIKCDTAVN